MKYLLPESWPLFAVFGIISGLLFSNFYFTSIILLGILALYFLILLILKIKPVWLIIILLIISFSFLRGYGFHRSDNDLPGGDGHIITARSLGASSQRTWTINIPVEILSIDSFSSHHILRNTRAIIQIPEDKAYLLVKKPIKKGDIIVLRANIHHSRNFRYLFDMGLNMQKTFNIRPVRIFSIISCDKISLIDHIRNITKPLRENTRSLIIPLLTGSRDFMQCEDRIIIQRSGLFHVFVISGFHIGLIAFILFSFFNVFLSKRSSIPIVLIILFLYILEIGMPISALRAFIMIFVFLISYLLNKNPSSSFVLSLSILIILLINPADIFSISFIMSILAVGGIIYSIPLIRIINTGNKVFDYFGKTWMISFFPLLFIAPVLLMIFNYFSLWGMMVFPIISFIIFFLLIFCLMMIIYPLSFLYPVIEFLVYTFRLFIRHDFISLFIFEANIHYYSFNLILLILIFYSLIILLYFILGKDRSIVFYSVFIILILALMAERGLSSSVNHASEFQKNISYFNQRQGMIYEGELDIKAHDHIKWSLRSENINKLILIIPYSRRLFPNISYYSRYCEDIFLYIIDNDNDMNKNIWTYTLLRKHDISFKIRRDSNDIKLFEFPEDHDKVNE